MLVEGPTDTTSQGSGGSPVNFLDTATCDAILEGLRDADGTMPDFTSPDSPAPELERDTTPTDRSTQTRVKRTAEKAMNTFTDVTHTATQVVSRPHLWTSATQTAPIVVPSQDAATQDHLRPSRRYAFTQTARPARYNAVTQTARPGSYHRNTQTDSPPPSIASSTSMAPVLVATTGCQAGAYFNNDLIPPGVLRLRLPWSYTYGQFEALLLAYPTVHPEDFVTFGVLQAQPRRGSQCEWGEVAGVLSHMAGGRRLLVDAFFTVMRRIQRLARDDPMRAVEEDALVTIVLDERRRSNAPLGDGAYSTLAAPGGPLALAAPQRDTRRRPRQTSSAPPPRRPMSPQAGPSRGRGRRRFRAAPGPSGAQGGPSQEFVDLTSEEAMETPATPPPQVSGDEEMNTDDEDRYLGPRDDDNSDDGAHQAV